VSALVRRVGDAALLIEIEPSSRHVAARAVSGAGIAGVIDVVAGERSVLVTFDLKTADVDALEEQVAAAVASPARTWIDPSDEISIAVRYDGPDLDEVAALTGLEPSQVIARHLAGSYVVAFMGFAPGFGYLDGLDPTLRVPRLATPRTKVQPGSVAIAGGRSCVYPGATPGGWRVLGHTERALFDTAADPPSALWAGRRVRFVRV
jgi:KipI family sensor histidine kinase inhibitor